MTKTADISQSAGTFLVKGHVNAAILACQEGLSFWGGVDPKTGKIIDANHSQFNQSVTDKILMMPTSRGSCSGSGVLLELALNGLAPAALIFCEAEEILSLGALVAQHLFETNVPVIYLSKPAYEAMKQAEKATITDTHIQLDNKKFAIDAPDSGHLSCSKSDQAYLKGAHGKAAQIAMEIICLMARAMGASSLVSVTKGHIDGCILAHDANLLFAEKMRDLGAQITIPTTINAISVDRDNWMMQGIPADFGSKASRLADAYVAMGAAPVFTCAPYLLDDAPQKGDVIGWSESNAVIYANSVLGARTQKHPDYLDLFIAMTGRAPAAGVYYDNGRQAQTIISVPRICATPDSDFWPTIGWLCGTLCPHQIPLITGLEALAPSQDDLKNLCAAFGTTSGAPLLHIAGHTPEADLPAASEATHLTISASSLRTAFDRLSPPMRMVDLIAIGSPHASYQEIIDFLEALDGRTCHKDVCVIITSGRETLSRLKKEGIDAHVRKAGITLVPDICWCSITEPVYPATAKNVMTNSGKYAHYSYGLTGRKARLASLDACAEAAVEQAVPNQLPNWLASDS